MPDDNVRKFPGGRIQESNEALRIIRHEMEHGMPALIDALAEVTWMKYQAYLRAGFTAEQALELCCSDKRDF